MLVSPCLSSSGMLLPALLNAIDIPLLYFVLGNNLMNPITEFVLKPVFGTVPRALCYSVGIIELHLHQAASLIRPITCPFLW